MITFSRVLLIAALTSVLAAAEPTSQPASAKTDTLGWDQVKSRILEQFRKHKYVSGRVNTHVFRKVSDGEIESQGSGSFDMKLGPDKNLVRMEMTDNSIRTTTDGVKQETRSTLSISDGESVHTLAELEVGRYNAFRVLHQGSDTFDVSEITQHLDAEHNITVLKDDTVDGTAVFVVEASPKVFNGKLEIQRRRYFFAKNSGLLIQRFGFNEAGAQREHFRILDVRFDSKIPDERFEFKPPEGVQVTDLTTQQQPKRP